MSMFLPSPTKTSTSVFQPNGAYFGVVTRVDAAKNRVWLQIPRVFADGEIGPTAVVGPVLPKVGDRVAVQFTENQSNDVIVTGVFLAVSGPRYVQVRRVTSETHPADPAVGDVIVETDTGAMRVWSGAAWRSAVVPSPAGGPLYCGSGVPVTSAGEVGDWYVDGLTGTTYEKTAEAVWTAQGSLAGPAANTLRSGFGAPDPGLGIDGDFYMDRTAAALYGPKEAGSWGSPVLLGGA